MKTRTYSSLWTLSRSPFRVKSWQVGNRLFVDMKRSLAILEHSREEYFLILDVGLPCYNDRFNHVTNVGSMWIVEDLYLPRAPRRIKVKEEGYLEMNVWQ